jgi:hypothetical protein
VTLRARRYLHSLGAVFAVLAVIVLGMVAISPGGKELTPQGGFAAIVALLAYIVYAQRRTAALVKEEAEQSREEADRALERLRGSAALTTGVTLRWRVRTYVLSIVALVPGRRRRLGVERALLAAAGALCAPMFAWVAKALLGRIREPDVLRVGSMGIEDNIGLGLIPWQDIKSVFLHEYEMKGTKVASLSIDLHDPGTYLRRLGPVARFWFRVGTLGFGNAIRIQVQTLDMAPLALFRLIRTFHERALPAGAISGTGNYYVVDLPGGKLKQLMAELEKTFAGPAPASGAPTRRQEDLMASMDALIKAEKEQTSATRARAEKTTNWAPILAVVLAVLIMLLVGAAVFNA